jgi:hypothetical protein
VLLQRPLDQSCELLLVCSDHDISAQTLILKRDSSNRNRHLPGLAWLGLNRTPLRLEIKSRGESGRLAATGFIGWRHMVHLNEQKAH